jgi:hypothetical protein
MGILPDYFSGGLLDSMPSWLWQNPQSMYGGNASMDPNNPGPAATATQTTPPASIPLPRPRPASADTPVPPPASPPIAPPLPPMLGGSQPGGLAGLLNNNSNAILGYLAGALQGGNLGQSIGRGLQGWQQGQQTDMQRQAPAATYRALVAAGVPDATAQAAALHPEVMRAVTSRYLQKLPTFGVIGQDALGRRRYGFIDPFTRTTQPIDGPGPQGGPQREGSNRHE